MRVEEGAYANLVVPALLGRSRLDRRDRAFVTELTYGTIRMRRACDFLIDPFVDRILDAEVRAALRLGAFQLAFLDTPAHAAVSATVAVAPHRARGFVNAVLRRVAASLPPKWPDAGTELSYPEWVVERLVADLGRDDGLAALRKMNEPASVTTRDDGYVQDRASQDVARHVGAGPDEVVVDLCAGPGGKATLMAEAAPALVVACDVRGHRARLVADNARDLTLANVATVVADGRVPPVRERSVHRVLVDAPCSGLGALRRRPDARWRIEAAGVDRLVGLQRALLGAASTMLRRAGTLVYSVCTLTGAETVEIDSWLAAHHPELEPRAPPGPPWRPRGRGALLLPQDADSDGMFVLSLFKS